MKLVTAADAARARLAFFRQPDLPQPLGTALHAGALALPDEATVAQIDALDAEVRARFGEKPHPTLCMHCDECSEIAYPYVEVGDARKLGMDCALVCLPCLRRAVALAEEAP